MFLKLRLFGLINIFINVSKQEVELRLNLQDLLATTITMLFVSPRGDAHVYVPES